MRKDLRAFSALIKELKRESKAKEKKVKPLSQLAQKEQEMIRRIQMDTQRGNQNNLSRTAAYLDFYKRCPEIQWSFLAHLVSRNAGWNMTDLKGEWLPRLMSSQERVPFFQFLERGNWLIFQDAYPQLLIYEESRRRKTDLFYLLPYFHISKFMQSVWNYFWKTEDRSILTIGLIINEQNYIEKKVISNPFYQKQVLSSLEYKLQELLSLNQILFPYYPQSPMHQRQIPSLLGQTVHFFASLHERISLGKRLYDLLFLPHFLRGIEQWASETPHTASRKDYWAHLFNDVKDSLPGEPYQRRLENCRLIHSRLRLYSPRLNHVWPDVKHSEPETGDWFRDWKIVHYFLHPPRQLGDIQDAYCKTLEKLDFVVATQAALFPPES
ncbi:DUF2515 family protein [Ammoniphilus sp. 3BR4]|uniref:DUF2515 family protein n=1 Tax=Ammoniphilus sp. 3BR4 TaxID=3158265 RepID=UPI003465D4C7